jgi:hypothetical protein
MGDAANACHRRATGAKQLHRIGAGIMQETLQEFILRENIKRFERHLSATTDEVERALLLKMMREEKERLEAIC